MVVDRGFDLRRIDAGLWHVPLLTPFLAALAASVAFGGVAMLNAQCRTSPEAASRAVSPASRRLPASGNSFDQL